MKDGHTIPIIKTIQRHIDDKRDWPSIARFTGMTVQQAMTLYNEHGKKSQPSTVRVVEKPKRPPPPRAQLPEERVVSKKPVSPEFVVLVKRAVCEHFKITANDMDGINISRNTHQASARARYWFLLMLFIQGMRGDEIMEHLPYKTRNFGNKSGEAKKDLAKRGDKKAFLKVLHNVRKQFKELSNG